MTIQLEPYQLFMIAATSLAAFFGLGKVLAKQVLQNIEEKLTAFRDLRQDLKSLENTTNNVERDLLRIKVDIAQQYARRDDFLRLEAAIFAKFDALADKLDNLRERRNTQ